MDESSACSIQSKYGFCKCSMPVNTGPIIINKSDTYYPKAGMLRVGGTSFIDVRMLARQEWGLHFCREVLLSKNAEATRIALSSMDVVQLGRRIGFVSVHYTRDGIEHHLPSCWESTHHVLPLFSVWLIQAWIRRALEARRRTKMLAFAMGVHARLGLLSPLRDLHADVLRLMVKG